MGLFPLLPVAGGLDPQQLLAVVPLIKGTRLVQALVALQPDQLGVGGLGDRLGQLGLAGAGRALDEQRLAERVGQEDRGRDRLVGEVAGAAEPLADVLR